VTALVWVAVVLIGGAGSVSRFLADSVVAAAADRDFPVGTLAVNVSGTRSRPASCSAAPKASASSTTCAPTVP